MTVSVALRRVSSISLALAFVALATSGLAMLVVHRFGFQVRLHPVHNAFGIVMIIAGAVHTAMNWKPLVAHLRSRWARVLFVLLLGVMALLFLAGLTMPLDAEAIRQVEDLVTAGHR